MKRISLRVGSGVLTKNNAVAKGKLEKPDSPTHEFATGGIVTKIKADQFMLDKGRKMFLCNGYDFTSAKEFLIDHQHSKGTLFSQLALPAAINLPQVTA
jgi:glutamate 5-kinase